MLGSIIGLGAGLVLGTKLNISNEIMLNIGLVSSVALAPIMGPSSLLFALGLGVTTVAKNIIKEKYNIKREELEVQIKEQKIKISEESIHEVASKAAIDGFWCLTSTMAFTAIPLQLLTMVKGLGAVLAPISIITLVCKGWIYIINNPTKCIINTLLLLVISVIGYICLTTGDTGGTFTYFLSLISIPSMFSIFNKKDNNIENKSNKESKETVYSADNFLYGGTTNNASIVGTGLVLGQTILWGSGKDLLGTIVNSDASVLLDPIRLGILGIIILFLVGIGNTRVLSNIVDDIYLNKGKKENIYSKYYKESLSNLLRIGSLVYCMLAFNIFLVIGIMLIGLILNCIDSAAIKNLSIPMLLVVGILTGF